MAWQGYAGLGNANADGTFTEATYTGYRRRAFTLADAPDGRLTGQGEVGFPLVAGASITYNAIGLFPDPAGPVPDAIYPLDTVCNVPPGTRPRFMGPSVCIDAARGTTPTGLALGGPFVDTLAARAIRVASARRLAAPRRSILAKSLGTVNIGSPLLDVDSYLGANAGAGRWSFGYLIPIEAPCYGVALIFGNCTSQPMKIEGASVTPVVDYCGLPDPATVTTPDGPPWSAQNFITPSGGAPTQRVYFDNRGLGGTPATDVPNLAGTNRSLALPGIPSNTGNAAVPYVIATSDFAPVTSLPRADGSAQPLLFVVVTVSGNLVNNTVADAARFCFDKVASSRASGNRAFYGGLRAWYNNADYTMDLTAGGGGWAYSGWGPLLGIRYISQARGVQIVVSGDSLIAAPTTDAYSSAITRAAWDLSTPELPIEVVNLGAGGASLPNYGTQLLSNCLLLKPSIVGQQFLSRNNGLGPNNTLQMLIANGMATFDALEYSYGTAPLILNPGCEPSFDGNSQATGAYQDMRARCAAIGGQAGIPVVDGPAVLGDPAKPWNYIPGVADDDTHPNGTGAELVVPQAKAALRRLIGL